jgi:DNA-binding IclR family transcriptional regulator
MGEVAAAISVAGHSNRLTEEVMGQIATDVMSAATAIAAAIGSDEHTDETESKELE